MKGAAGRLFLPASSFCRHFLASLRLLLRALIVAGGLHFVFAVVHDFVGAAEAVYAANNLVVVERYDAVKCGAVIANATGTSCAVSFRTAKASSTSKSSGAF